MIVVQSGSEWFRAILGGSGSGSEWFRAVLLGVESEWFRVVQSGSGSFSAHAERSQQQKKRS